MTESTLEAEVIQALKEIFDPEIPVNIYDLGLIYSIDIDETARTVKVEMTLTTPMCPVAQTFPQTVQDKILQLPNINSVSVNLVWDPPWTQDTMSDEAKLQLNLL